MEHKHKRVESESEKIDAIVRLNARSCFVLSCFVLFTHSSCPSPIPFTPRQVHRASPWPPPLEWMWGPLSTASRGSWPPSLLTIITHTPALKHSPHHPFLWVLHLTSGKKSVPLIILLCCFKRNVIAQMARANFQNFFNLTFHFSLMMVKVW